MNPKIIYPIPVSQNHFYRRLRSVIRFVFLIAALTCLIVNLAVGGKLWCLIVMWSLFALWRLVFSLRLVEFSIYAHAVRAFFYIAVLLILIDHFLAPGWAQTVVPIVLFGALLIMGIIYYVTYDKRERHVVSVLILGLFVILSVPYSLHSWPITNWIAFAFSLASILLFTVLVILNFKDVVRELKVRFKA